MILSSFQVLPPGKGSLYNRLFLMGTEVVLGLAPAPEYTFLAYLCFSCWKLLQGCSSLTSGYLVIVDMTLDLVTGNHYVCVTCCTRILVNNSKCVLAVSCFTLFSWFSLTRAILRTPWLSIITLQHVFDTPQKKACPYFCPLFQKLWLG